MANSPFLFHGTNIIAAVHIFRQKNIKADRPVDAEDDVVCLTEAKRVARAFAVEFARHNSRLPAGAIFALDANLTADIPSLRFQSETASFDERELRVAGNVSLKKYLRGVSLVGRVSCLRSDRWMENAYESEDTGFRTYSLWADAVNELIKASAR